ncbi:MAG TPA: DNA recombination protein RmuC [Candidatus Megaira endosymbiont of Nemacystus decipiens]|nr:DNA recombination protein RmuC [Candidatus Megaera endosymbiont of Nemacystus decipiens]
MLYYLATAYILFSLVLIIFLIIDRAKRKIKEEIYLQELSDITNQHEVISKEKIELIRNLEKLAEKNRCQDRLLNESQKLKEESKEATKAALFDLGNKLSNQLIELHKRENHETRKLSEKNIEQTISKFNSEFERISNIVSALNKDIVGSKDTVDIIKNSLLSPSGAGALAEITLENILKSSGLRNNIDFRLQYSVNNESESSILRPDAVVFLPNERLMIIDSKASKFLMDPNSDNSYLSKSMNTHLKSLAAKNYSDSVKKYIKDKNNTKVSTITLMFLPSEQAVEKIVESDKNFLNKAWNLNIFPVGPSGIMNMLSFAKFQISEKQVNDNNIKIIDEVQKLISSVGSMADHAMKLGNSISSTVNHYDKFAASFNKNFLTKAKKLDSMGIDSSLKKSQESLKRLQLFTSKSDLIELEAEEIKTPDLEKLS